MCIHSSLVLKVVLLFGIFYAFIIWNSVPKCMMLCEKWHFTAKQMSVLPLHQWNEIIKTIGHFMVVNEVIVVCFTIFV